MDGMINVVLLGATGSIGKSTLEVIRAHPDRLRLLGIAAHSNQEHLQAIAREFAVPHTSLFAKDGVAGLNDLASLPEADVVLVATTGTISLEPTVTAMNHAKTVALAAKEILVLAGEWIRALQKAGGSRLLPVDSEHNAIFQCLEALQDPGRHLKRILLTASGGPFRERSLETFEKITMAEALRHPNWSMGQKITIDSATMANKGLEMMEARWLFDLNPDQIDVLIHPQSIIHSLIESIDGSVLAQLAPPSMTFPIQHCLFYPERATPSSKGLDFREALSLELYPPDFNRYPCLRLAMDCIRADEPAPAVFNAANSVAVQAFLDQKISFTAIPKIIEKTLADCSALRPARSIEGVQAIESQAMAVAREKI